LTEGETKVVIHSHNVIYHLFADLIHTINSKLPTEHKEEVLGGLGFLAYIYLLYTYK